MENNSKPCKEKEEKRDGTIDKNVGASRRTGTTYIFGPMVSHPQNVITVEMEYLAMLLLKREMQPTSTW